MSAPKPLMTRERLPDIRVDSLILDGLRTYQHELESLRFFPELRYDRTTFPTIGQYDWLAGQVLYALVRMIRPRILVEFSTSSGYSTTFSALAVRENGTGVSHSVDLDAHALGAAGRWLDRQGLSSLVHLHHGDCRDVVPGLLNDAVDIVFIDTLHSFDITEWYLQEVVPAVRGDCLVHVHDVMPPEARVRIHGGPPFTAAPSSARSPFSHLVKRFVWLLLHGRWPNPMPAPHPRETFPLERLQVFPPKAPGELATIDGNYFEEALLIRDLLRDSAPEEAVYLHRLEPRIPLADLQRYAALDRIGRTDRWGEPLEWNDALWCRAATMVDAVSRSDFKRLCRDWRRRGS